MKSFQFPASLQGIILLIVAGLTLASLTACQKKDESQEEGDKKWKLSMIKFEELRQTEDAEKGFREGLKAAGLVETEDYTMITRSAQGDLPTVLTMLDATATDGTDMIISLQTTTLNSAVTRSPGIPLVFMVVANPFIITTVGESDEAHLPYLTGVYTNTTFEGMLGYIKACVPDIRSIGTLFSTAELNATFYKQQLLDAASVAGLKVETFGVSDRLDMSQSVQALCNKDIQAICQIEDNLTSARFETIVKTAREYNIPVFSFVNDQAEKGSILVVAPDYQQGARRVAELAARIMRGENPQNIPFEQIQKFDLIVNMKAAKEAGITIPEDILRKADVVLNEE